MMELEHFPLDEQDLSVDLSLDQPANCAVLCRNRQFPSSMTEHNFPLTGVYSLFFKSVLFDNFGYTDKADSSSGMVYSSWKNTVKIQRKSGFYVSNVVIPMASFSLLSFLSFGILEDGTKMDTSSRLSITLTLLLTAVAYKFVVSSSLPQISYPTLLDRYVWLCLGNILLVAVENVFYPVLVFKLGQRYSGNEYFVLLVLVGLFVTSHIVWGGMVLLWYKRREKENKFMLNNEMNSREQARNDIENHHAENRNKIVSDNSNGKMEKSALNDNYPEMKKNHSSFKISPSS
jgi:hypothetical protein